MYENKCGGGTTLTSNSVAQKTVKFKFGLCNAHSLIPYYNKEALKYNKF
jgi:hypothetical protein